MTTPTGDQHATDGESVDPIADDRGKQGTNYPHGVGDHPDTTRTSDVDDPIASERGSEGTNYPHGVGDHPDGDAWEDDLK